MKKILINFLYWGEKETGLYRSGFNIIKNLVEISEDELFCITNYYQDLKINNLEIIPKNIIFKKTVPKIIEFQFYLLEAIQKIKPDLVFNPFHYGVIFKKINQISIIHDLIYLTTFKKKLFSYFYHKYILKKLLNNCKLILVPSYTTKYDLINIFQVPEYKLKVIYWGIEEKFKKLDLQKEKFFLIVNAPYPYKNVDYIIKAWKKFKIEENLIIILGTVKFKKYADYLKRMINDLNLHHKILLFEKVNDETLIQLYNQAKALISASLKEGFNLPPLEALACGTPVILSDIPVHREIYGDIGIFFDLNNEESFLNALNQVEKINYEDFEKKRLEFIKRFSWQKTAEEIYKIIKECIEE